MSLKNKVAIVTGSGQGVGQGIAVALAREGARLVLTGRTEKKLEATKKLIEEIGGEAITLSANVKSEDDLKATLDKTLKAFGKLDILVNNAQEVPLGTLHQVSDETFTAGWESGPLAVFRFMKLAYPHLKETNGSIINLASTATKRWNMTGYGAYAAVKEAIVMLTRAAASEWGPDNIRVNAIFPHAKSPGLVWWMENHPKEAEEFQASIPLRRVGELDEIGRFVAMLCSEASSYVSGQCIAIDGGQANMA